MLQHWYKTVRHTDFICPTKSLKCIFTVRKGLFSIKNSPVWPRSYHLLQEHLYILAFFSSWQRKRCILTFWCFSPLILKQIYDDLSSIKWSICLYSCLRRKRVRSTWSAVVSLTEEGAGWRSTHHCGGCRYCFVNSSSCFSRSVALCLQREKTIPEVRHTTTSTFWDSRRNLEENSTLKYNSNRLSFVRFPDEQSFWLTGDSWIDSGRFPADVFWLSGGGFRRPAPSASGPPADRGGQRS